VPQNAKGIHRVYVAIAVHIADAYGGGEWLESDHVAENEQGIDSVYITIVIDVTEGVGSAALSGWRSCVGAGSRRASCAAGSEHQKDRQRKQDDDKSHALHLSPPAKVLGKSLSLCTGL
jgi:hypothetical protein